MFKFFTALALATGFIFPAQVALFAQVDNSAVVTDNAGMFSQEQENQILAGFAESHQNYDVAAVLETMDSLNGQDIDTYATSRANELGVGDADKDNGIYVLIVENDRKFQFETGIGITQIVSAGDTQSIIDSVVTPEFKSGNVIGGILAGVDAIGSKYAGGTDGTGVDEGGAVTGSTPTDISQAVTTALSVTGIILAVIIFGLVGARVLSNRAKRVAAEQDEVRREQRRQDEILNSKRINLVNFTAKDIIRDRKDEFVNARNNAERKAIIEPYVQEHLKDDRNFAETVYSQITWGVMENLLTGKHDVLPRQERPRIGVQSNDSVAHAMKLYVKSVKQLVPGYLKRKAEAEKKAAAEREAGKFWSTLSHSQRDKLRNAGSRSQKEKLMREYGSGSGFDMSTLVPLMFVYYASSLATPTASYGSSYSSSSSSSSSSYSSPSSYDFGGSSFGGGSFDGGGGGGSW